MAIRQIGLQSVRVMMRGLRPRSGREVARPSFHTNRPQSTSFLEHPNRQHASRPLPLCHRNHLYRQPHIQSQRRRSSPFGPHTLILRMSTWVLQTLQRRPPLQTAFLNPKFRTSKQSRNTHRPYALESSHVQQERHIATPPAMRIDTIRAGQRSRADDL